MMASAAILVLWGGLLVAVVLQRLHASDCRVLPVRSAAEKSLSANGLAQAVRAAQGSEPMVGGMDAWLEGHNSGALIVARKDPDVAWMFGRRRVWRLLLALIVVATMIAVCQLPERTHDLVVTLEEAQVALEAGDLEAARYKYRKLEQLTAEKRDVLDAREVWAFRWMALQGFAEADYEDRAVIAAAEGFLIALRHVEEGQAAFPRSLEGDLIELRARLCVLGMLTDPDAAVALRQELPERHLAAAHALMVGLPAEYNPELLAQFAEALRLFDEEFNDVEEDDADADAEELERSDRPAQPSTE